MIYFGRIVEPDLGIQLEIGKFNKSGVELQESAHDLIIYFRRHFLGELIRDDPIHSLSLDLCLVIDPLDTEEHLSETLTLDQIEIELPHESTASLDHSLIDLIHFVSREDTV